LDSRLLERFHQKATEAVISFRGNFATYYHFQQEWSENLLFNLVHHLKGSSISELKDCCKEIPALIVGSGPSLQEDIHMLHDLKEHCLLIAAGSSIQALLHHGIEPHLIVSMDGGEANFAVFRDLEIEHIPLLYAPIIKYKILDHKKSLLLHVFLNIDPVTPFILGQEQPDPKFLSTATVTGTAIQAASYLGCTKIILMGQDLSYPNHQFYAQGVDHIAEEVIQRNLSAATLEVDNVSGGRNKTTKKMLNTLRDMETLLKLFPQVEFINTSKHGANIKGTRFLPLESIIDELKMSHFHAHEFLQTISELTSGIDEERTQSVIHKLNQAASDIKEIEQHLNELEKAFRQIEHPATSMQSLILTRLKKIDQKWTAVTEYDIFKKLYVTAMNAHFSIYMRHVPNIVAEQDPVKKAGLIRTHLGRLVAAMKLYTNELNKLIPQAIERIHRIKEYSA
jgi:hypothetical protein